MIYVMSDIHGHKKQFDEILNMVNFSGDDTLYILGDIVDKGPACIELLKIIMNAPNIHMLLGNHEQMMLDVVDYQEDDVNSVWSNERLWYNNGGRFTRAVFDDEDDSTKAEIIKFLRGLPLCFDVTVAGTEYKLVHASPIELFDGNFYTYKSAEQFAVWHRFQPDYENQAKETIIFGHTPTSYYQEKPQFEVWYGNNLIGIDCACAYDGRLACVRLDDMAVFYSHSVLLD